VLPASIEVVPADHKVLPVGFDAAVAGCCILVA
jgi:hypothetical protein